MKKINFSKKSSLTWLFLLFGISFSYAQTGPITLSLRYDGTKYRMYLKPTATPTGASANLTDGSSVITVVVPVGVTASNVVSVTPTATWTLSTTVPSSSVDASDQLSGTPTGKDFLVFTPSGDFSSITYAGNVEIELFNFQVSNVCLGNLDILPSDEQTAGGGTLNIGSYYSVDGYAGGIGTNHFVGTYDMSSVISATPTLSTITNPTSCVTPNNTGSFSVTSPALNTGFTYSSNGTTFQTSNAFSGLNPSTSYNVSVKNTLSGCVSPNVVAAIGAAPAAPSVPALSVTQPNCATSTGTITVTSTATGLEYSINDGATYVASASFSGLSANTYNVRVRNTTTLCVSAQTQATVNAALSVPAAPTLSVTQPICATPTGTITVTSTATGLEYSINNGLTYQTSTAFNNLSQGTYNVTVRNTSTSCVSAQTQATVNAAPAAPVAPTLSVTQPTSCIAPNNTGTVTVTSPATGTGFEYSIDSGAYGASASFSGLSAKTYSVTVRNVSTSCVSALSTATVNAAPAPPVAPTLSVTQPTSCIAPNNTGTITVTSTATGLEYSIDGGAYGASASFSGLLANTYSVRVRNTTTLCVSNVSTETVNAAPAAPSTPTVTVVDPTCAIPTGSITVTAPLGTFEYSLNSGPYQTTLTFAGLAPGLTYTIVARNTTTSCVSLARNGTIGALPTNCSVLVSVKVLLQGAGSTKSSPYTANTGGLMRDDLRQLNLIPSSQPYTALGFTTPAIPSSTVAASVLAATGVNAIVDWVLVELRDGTTASTVLARKAALLQADGDVVDVDGTSPVSFGLINGNYKVAVLHRNHLGVMTANNVALTSTTSIVDFTSTSVATFGTTAQIMPQVTISGKNYLWAGKVNTTATGVTASGGTNSRSPITAGVTTGGKPNTTIIKGYALTDVNMDGRTIAQGINADNSYILRLIVNHPLNTGRTNVYNISSTLP